MGTSSSTSFTSSMYSLKTILYVCVLFVIGMEAAPKPEPKPTAPWYGGYPGYRSGGYPPYYGGNRRASCFCPRIIAPVCGVDGVSYGCHNCADGAGVKVACKGNCPCKGAESYDPRCDGTGRAFCCNWGGNGIDCGCYC